MTTPFENLLTRAAVERMNNPEHEEAIIAWLSGELTALAMMAPTDDDDTGTTYQEAALKALETLRRRRTPGAGDQIDIPTGFTDLDSIIGGFRRGRLVTITAPTGMGKSAFIHNIIENMGIYHGTRTLMFSLEMSDEEIGDRTLAHSGHDKKNLDALERYVNGMDLPIKIFDQPASLPEIVTKTRQLAGALDIIVVDYAQLVRPTSKVERRERAVAEVSGTLKNLSRELNLVVIAAAQLNRGGDIRESAAIEHDSDLWLVIDRKEESAVVDVQIKKNRHGPRKNFTLTWVGDRVSFENAAAGGHPVPNAPEEPAEPAF